MINRLRHSLNAKFAGMLALSFLLALLSFLSISKIGDRIVLDQYMDERSISERESKLFGEFANYVHKYNVASTNGEAIMRWCLEHKYASVAIYNEQSGTIFNDDNTARIANAISTPYQGRLFTLRFADTLCRVTVSDSSEARFYAIVDVIAIVISAIIIIAIMLTYISVVTARLINISNQAAKISGGEMDGPITTSGTDEIAVLAKSMDSMRHSIIERMGSENRALQANHDLITAISHDIRTPMTSMLAYLGMLNESDLSEPERAKTFIASAYKKALELKELTDVLFKYFLVFGKNEIDMNTEEFDAELLLDQLISEAEFELIELGYRTKRLGQIPSGTVNVDALLLKRVLDNLISNVKKYADESYLIVFLIESNKKNVSVCVSNNVKHFPQAESTKIGLRTCEKIMDGLGGKFLTATDADHFMAEFSLPIKNNS